MLPLYHDPDFTFRFADDRIIPRFHLEGVEAGRFEDVELLDPYGAFEVFSVANRSLRSGE